MLVSTRTRYLLPRDLGWASSPCVFTGFCFYVYSPVKFTTGTGHAGRRESWRQRRQRFVLWVPGSGSVLQPRAACSTVPSKTQGVLPGDDGRQMSAHVQRKEPLTFDSRSFDLVCPETAAVNTVCWRDRWSFLELDYRSYSRLFKLEKVALCWMELEQLVLKLCF